MLTRALRRLREVGPLDAARFAAVKAEAALWNRVFRAKTEGGPSPGPEFPESVRYEPLPWKLVRKSIDALALQPHDVFLDYGSGMGRALLMAARKGPRRVIGVELMEPLVHAARRNAEGSRHRLKAPIEVHVADATTWTVPDDVTSVYLFNPFVGSVMAAAQARLRESLQRRPRGVRVLYARVRHEPNSFAGCDWLRFTRTVDPGVFRDLSLEVYVSK